MRFYARSSLSSPSARSEIFSPIRGATAIVHMIGHNLRRVGTCARKSCEQSSKLYHAAAGVLTLLVPCSKLAERVIVRRHPRNPKRRFVDHFLCESRSWLCPFAICEHDIARERTRCASTLRLFGRDVRATVRDHFKVIATSTKLVFLTRDSGTSSSSSSPSTI